MTLDRRTFLAGAAASALLPLPARAQSSGDPAAMLALDETAEALLLAYPENAANLGIDTGGRVALKSKLSDKSPAADHARAADAARRLARLRALDRSQLSAPVALHVDVATEAFRIAVDGWKRMPAIRWGVSAISSR